MVDIKPDEGHQLETMNEVEFLNYVQESESIWRTKCRILNETYETPSLDGIEVEKEDAAELPSPFSESAVPKKSKTK